MWKNDGQRVSVLLIPLFTEKETWAQRGSHLTMFPRAVWPREMGRSGLGQKIGLSFDQKRTTGLQVLHVGLTSTSLDVV